MRYSPIRCSRAGSRRCMCPPGHYRRARAPTGRDVHCGRNRFLPAGANFRPKRRDQVHRARGIHASLDSASISRRFAASRCPTPCEPSPAPCCPASRELRTLIRSSGPPPMSGPSVARRRLAGRSGGARRMAGTSVKEDHRPTGRRQSIDNPSTLMTHRRRCATFSPSGGYAASGGTRNCRSTRAAARPVERRRRRALDPPRRTAQTSHRFRAVTDRSSDEEVPCSDPGP
jgi:hypothetical protein